MFLKALDELFVLRNRRIMPWSRVGMYLLVLALCNGWWYRADLITPPPLLPNDGHALISLAMAVNRAYCGYPSKLLMDLQSRPVVGRLLLDDRLRAEPIEGVLVDKWQTVDGYCATNMGPYLNNENSLMLLESWIMRAAPRVSLAGIGRILLVLKLLMVGLFCAALLRGGMSVLVSVGVVEVAAAILHQLQPMYAYSVYSFFLPLTLLPIALYSLTAEASRRIPVRLTVALLGGVVSAYGVNMRTSYLPLYLAVFLLSLLAGEWLTVRRRALRPRVLVSAAAIALFAAGYGAFQYAFIVRSRPSVVTYPSLSYHVVWHPTVLSLAIPPNPLSEREGILWSDATGLMLARRIDPSVEYLGPGYEAALSTYYFSLWKKYPSDMRQIYLTRFTIAGRHMIENARFPSVWMTSILAILAWVPNGVWLFAGLAVCSLASFWWHVRSGGAALLAVAQLACVGALLVVEAAMIMPFYYLTYHQTLLFACAVTTLFLGQLVLDVPALLIQRLITRRTSKAIA